MTALSKELPVGVVGAGTMGAGIAQVAAMAGHSVRLVDAREGAAESAVQGLRQRLARIAERGRLAPEEAAAIGARLIPAGGLAELAGCGLVIEAIVEDMKVKRELFGELETILSADAILATNTSSLSITAMAAHLERPGRLVGMHFFNPAPLMALVEVVSGLATDPAVAGIVFETARLWGKAPVHAANTPGFIVNRVARPFYGEAFRLLAEQAGEPATIDALMRESGGFRMGPFELTDLIGQDVNAAVSRSVFEAYDYDPRYRPSLVQRELVDAGRLGRKSGRGIYDHAEGATRPEPATAPAGPKPQRIVAEGLRGPAEALLDLAATAGIEIERREQGPGLMRLDGIVLALTDGVTADEHTARTGGSVFLFDLALDYAAATRIGLAAPLRASDAQRAAAAGFFQALGKSVSFVGDLPGMVVMRTVAMLANEAAEAVHSGVADAQGVDTAMRKGVNYPAGPLAWAERIGTRRIVETIDHMARAYGEDRYRCSLGLRRLLWQAPHSGR
ncbi:3-hydroxyacyl-CoA dehydrogenase [Geminicoccaceae bacterium 1502E]|nr:3-hydroxyacyl-CoA dehydrogenase [Geminicoccaceae bacterium 1502E]